MLILDDDNILAITLDTEKHSPVKRKRHDNDNIDNDSSYSFLKRNVDSSSYHVK